MIVGVSIGAVFLIIIAAIIIYCVLKDDNDNGKKLDDDEVSMSRLDVASTEEGLV
jgi:hypothetical protein